MVGVIEPWIQLLGGMDWEPLKPDPKKISITTIARILSRIPRFNGHTREFYSVAEHSMYVARVVAASNPELEIAALLHDAHEAYSGYGDVASPVKTLNIKGIEREIDRVIAEHFNFPQENFYRVEVKEADIRMLVTEARDLLEPCERQWHLNVPPYDAEVVALDDPKLAEQMFLARVCSLGLIDKVQ